MTLKLKKKKMHILPIHPEIFKVARNRRENDNEGYVLLSRKSLLDQNLDNHF